MSPILVNLSKASSLTILSIFSFGTNLIKSVIVGVGPTAFTVIPKLDSSLDITIVKFSIADFDAYGNLETKRAGRVTISAQAEDVKESFKISVVKNPTRSVTLNTDKNQIRTGDVLRLSLIHI